MMSVVIDPGVLVSALIARRLSAPVALVELWRAHELQLFVSPHLLTELAEVLARPKFRPYVTEQEVSSYVALFYNLATHTDDPKPQESFTADPDDDYLIALARAVGAEYLVSGDRHLTVLKDMEPPIVTPGEFLRIIREETSRKKG